jgi:hypothetical protein
MTHGTRMLVAMVGLASSTPVAALAQGSLDARSPGSHRYTIEVWFMRKDKPGTFKSRFFDPSIPGQYDAPRWEDFRTRMNDPSVGGVSRRVEFTTREGVRETERQQIEALVRQERDRVESRDPKFVGIPPVRREQTRDAGKAEFGHDDKANRSPERTVTDQDLDGSWIVPPGGYRDPMILFATRSKAYPDGRYAVYLGPDPVYGHYKIDGNRITFNGRCDYGYIKEIAFDGTWEDGVINARIRKSLIFTVLPREDEVRSLKLIKIK